MTRTTARLPVIDGAVAYRYTALPAFTSRRRRLGLSQSAMARAIGRDQSLVCRFEAGQVVRAGTAERLAAGIGLTLDEAVRVRVIRRDRGAR